MFALPFVLAGGLRALGERSKPAQGIGQPIRTFVGVGRVGRGTVDVELKRVLLVAVEPFAHTAVRVISAPTTLSDKLIWAAFEAPSDVRRRMVYACYRSWTTARRPCARLRLGHAPHPLAVALAPPPPTLGLVVALLPGAAAAGVAHSCLGLVGQVLIAIIPARRLVSGAAGPSSLAVTALEQALVVIPASQ